VAQVVLEMEMDLSVATQSLPQLLQTAAVLVLVFPLMAAQAVQVVVALMAQVVARLIKVHQVAQLVMVLLVVAD
jgi:hypothetical protein